MNACDGFSRTGRLCDQQRTALFSACGTFRYLLSIIWDLSNPVIAFLMLNPSTADENADDPTVRKCIKYARRWGFGGVWILNLYALRSTDPRGLGTFEGDPTGGAFNDDAIEWAVRGTQMVVCAWGNNASFERANAVIDRIHPIAGALHALKINDATSKPTHPLYLSNDRLPFSWVHARGGE